MKITIAKIISHTLDPSLVWPFFLLMILLGTDMTKDQMQVLFIPLFLFEVLLPVALIGYFRRIGKVSDWEMTDVKERRLFFLVVSFLHVGSLICLYIWGTDLAWQIRLIVLIVEIMGTIVTFFWKISVHLAAFTLGALMLNILFGWQWWPLFLVIPILMWARIVRKKHTLMQTIAGTVLTLVVVSTALWWFNIPLI